MSGPYTGYPDPNRPSAAAGGPPRPPPLADLTSGVGGSSGGPSPFSHPGQPLHHGHPHSSHGEQLYGPPGGNGGGGGGYYASSNTAMAASNYGSAPTHASPGGFASVDSSGHAMLPPMHVLPTPTHHHQQQQQQEHHQQQQQHQLPARRSMGSGEFQSLPAPPSALMTAGDAQLPMPHGLPQPHPGYQHRGSVSGGYALGQPPSGSASGSSSGSTAMNASTGPSGNRGLTSPTGAAHSGVSGQAGGAAGGASQEPKSRSAMACQLCRCASASAS